jgi:uncharacterized SAM-dependent methyltransferase
MSLQDQDVYIAALETSFHFEKFEALHLESSFKFSESEIHKLASQTGFKIEAHFTDVQHYFIDALWQVQKS